MVRCKGCRTKLRILDKTILTRVIATAVMFVAASHLAEARKRPRVESPPVQPVGPAPVKPRPKPDGSLAPKPDKTQPSQGAETPNKPVPGPGEASQAPREDKPPADDGAACRAKLESAGAAIEIPHDMVLGKGCAVANPVTLKSLRTPAGMISLPGKPILNCNFATKFVTWLADVASPIVIAHEHAMLVTLSASPGFQCRARVGEASAKMSEHASGNAIDIDGLVLAGGRRIEIASVSDPASPDHRLLMALRISACGYFTTVLGPGSNAAHASHYHFDLGLHGKSANYRICE